MKKILLLLFTLFISFAGFSQDFSNKGKDFWIAYPAHIDGNTSVMGIYITSDVGATGSITVGAVVLPFSLTANTVVRKFIGPNASGDAPNTAVYLSTPDGVTKGAGIHVISDAPVAIYAHIIKSARSAASLILPTNVWGKNYVAAGYKSEGNQPNTPTGYGEITVMAKLANTTVEITPKAASINGVRAAGIPFQITLSSPGDVYQLQFAAGADLSGTTINSVANASGGCNPIAVTSGSSWTSMGCTGASGGDNLYQQLFPTTTWGKTFLTAPYLDRPFDIVRVFVTDASTVITKTENGISKVLTGLTAGNFYEYTTSLPTQLQADKPIAVVHYIVSQSCKAGCSASSTTLGCLSDPEMIILNPVEQTVNNITVFSAHQNWVPAKQSNVVRCLLNIIIKKNAAQSFTINGNSPNGIFTAITGTEYAYLQEDVTDITISNPVQTLSADSAFSAIAYGFGLVESYGYNAGTNVKDLSQQIAIVSQYGIEQTPSSCQGSPFKFKIALPYQPDSLYWNFNGDTNQLPSANVWQVPAIGALPKLLAADSISIVNNKLSYWYSLPVNYTFTAVGVYPVTVTAYKSLSDGCGNTSDIQFNLQIFAPPVADFSWLSNGCVNQAVQFKDSTTATKPIYKWNWNFGDSASGINNTATVKNPAHQFSAAGTYTVAYTNITTPGCLSNTATKQIIVTAVPAAKFGISAIRCATQAIIFSDSSINYANSTLTKWYWDYGDGATDTLTNGSSRTHFYTPWGTKTIGLKVATISGCESALNNQVFVVNPNPVANFTLPAGICLPADSSRFINTSTIADGSQATLNYAWTFGDLASGKNDSATARNPVHYYTNGGPFAIHLHTLSAAGCAADATQILSNTFAPAIAGFTVNADNCLQKITQFTSTSVGSGNTITNWYWDFGDGSAVNKSQNATNTFGTVGLKNIKHWVTTDKGCTSDTLSKTVTINPLPVGRFSTTGPYCSAALIGFKDSSTVVTGSITNWNWNVGDSNGSLNLTNSAAFTYAYAAANNYTVTLTVITDKGCVNTTVPKTISINPLPRAGFIIPEVCLSDSYAQFKDSSSIAAGNISKWLWNFGDAGSAVLNSSTLQNTQHKYSAAGPYIVSLFLTSNAGCTNNLVQNFFVNGGNPVANFTINNAAKLCANDSVAITNTSTVVPGSITKVNIYWDNIGSPAVFDLDDFPAPGKIYHHGYANFQTPLTKQYTIRFRAYSGGICVDDKLQTITVNAAPAVQFLAIPNICLDAAPYLIIQAKEKGGVPGSYQFSGSGVSAAGIFSPAVAGAGTHRILYTFISTTGGCTDTAFQQVTVLAPPVASFIFSQLRCATKAVLFSSTSTASVGTITGYTWNFGDGTPVVFRTSPAGFFHSFSKAGNYTVSLTVVTSNGCNSLPGQVQVTIHPLPFTNFTVPASVCLPAAYARFNSSSTITDSTGNLFSYAWNFGDSASGANNIDTVKAPLHLYGTTGPYAVNLQVTSRDGCSTDTTIVVNTIHPQPKAAFSLSKQMVCLGDKVIFTDGSTGLDGTITNWNWNFGDGQSASTPSTTHLYQTDNSFSVALFITNSFGCNSDTLSKPFIVYPYPVVNAGADRVVLEGGIIRLQPTVSGNDLQFLWTPSSFLDAAFIEAPLVISPLNDIRYLLSVTARGGCTASSSVFVKLLKAPKLPNTFTPNGDGINDKWVIKYLESYPGCRIQVFTRTGQLVYEVKGYSDAAAWDGSFKGKPLPFDTYYYIVEPGSGRKPITGYVTIIK